MNKEELKQEAEEKYNERLRQNGIKVEYKNETYIDGYLDSAEPREKKITELEAQIEKMKCCGNCKKLRGRFDHNTHINILYCSDSDMREIEVGFQMCCCKWEIKENE